MAEVSISTMKEKVAEVYPGASWKYRVYNLMRDNQVMALYFKFQEDGTFNRLKDKKKIERENRKNAGQQMTIFDWEKEKRNE